VVEGPGNYVFKDDNHPRALRSRVVSFNLETYKAFIEREVVYTLEGSHWKGKLRKGLIGLVIRSFSAHFKSQSDQRAATSPARRVFPRCTTVEILR
jgi:hypothetical protein